MTQEAISGPPRNEWKRRRGTRPFTVAGDPSPEDLAVAAERHKGDAADRFSLYTPEQIMAETRSVRLDLSFGEVIKIRDQAEMVIAAMREIIAATRKHDIGTVRQRIEARAEAASLGRALTRLNGKTPHGEWKPKPKKS